MMMAQLLCNCTQTTHKSSEGGSGSGSGSGSSSSKNKHEKTTNLDFTAINTKNLFFYM